jgi:hypothetical protein
MVSFLVSFQGLLCDMFVRLSAPYMESRDIREEVRFFRRVQLYH